VTGSAATVPANTTTLTVVKVRESYLERPSAVGILRRIARVASSPTTAQNTTPRTPTHRVRVKNHAPAPRTSRRNEQRAAPAPRAIPRGTTLRLVSRHVTTTTEAVCGSLQRMPRQTARRYSCLCSVVREEKTRPSRLGLTGECYAHVRRRRCASIPGVGYRCAPSSRPSHACRHRSVRRDCGRIAHVPDPIRM
jgi:hypothetical protein